MTKEATATSLRYKVVAECRVCEEAIYTNDRKVRMNVPTAAWVHLRCAAKGEKQMSMPKPKTEGRYLKAPKAGQSVTFRILADPVEFYQAWKTSSDGKQAPVRRVSISDFKRGDYDETNKYGKQSPVYCQAFPIIGPSGDVMVFTAGQKTILDGLYALDNNPKWGELSTYDVVVTAKEDGKAYSVVPDPKTPLSEDATEKWSGLLRNGFDLLLLIDGKDPFKESGAAGGDDPANDDDIPF